MNLDYTVQKLLIPSKQSGRIKPRLQQEVRSQGLQLDRSRVSTEQTQTPSTNCLESREKEQRFHFDFCQSEKQLGLSLSTRFKNQPVSDQIQLILSENEKLRQHLNAKQRIIDTITKSRDNFKQRLRLDTLDSVRNSQSILAAQNPFYEDVFDKKQSVSQSFKRSLPRIISQKLPQIDDAQRHKSPPADDCNFTFANNFFAKPDSTTSQKRLNMLQAFPQYHLKRKFFT